MNSSLLIWVNVKGDTTLHLAAREGDLDAIKALIDSTKKLDAEGSVELESSSTMTKKMLRATNMDDDTALHDAVSAGETPFYITAEKECHEVVSEILKAFRTPAYGGPGGRTTLHAAIISNNQGSTKTLLDWKKGLA
ncbi:hypothetical protein ACSBR2_013172 [Camellia fascicularis]